VRGFAEAEAPFHARFNVSLDDSHLTFRVPVLHRWTDPVQGERYRVFEVTPDVAVQIEEPVVAFLDASAKNVRVTLTSGADGVSGNLRLSLPADWTATPAVIPFQLATKGDSRGFTFAVSPINHARTADYKAVAEVQSRSLSSAVATLDYPHFPPQTVLSPAEGHLRRLDLKRAGTRVGYV
jgi:hypothetical protein